MNKTASKLVFILLLFGIFSAFALSLFFFINPSQQAKKVRNYLRKDNLKELINLIDIYAKDNNGRLPSDIPLKETLIGSSEGLVNICFEIVPKYGSKLPFDSNMKGAYFKSCDDYNLGYTIKKDPNNKITIASPGAELGNSIEVKE